MVTQTVELITKEQLDSYIEQAANITGYQNGFGVTDCDLSKNIWWSAYCRQSLDQQTHNNRLPEYLLTLAKMAKEEGIVVPREYIFYDHETGEHLERPGMTYLRYKLAHKKQILGILFADIRCLSREPAPQQVFERECEILGIRLLFGDAPSGMDPGSQFARSAITFSNKLARLATHRNARAGNIGRILKGLVPSCKAAYGYVYRRDAEITSDGKVLIKKAWWEVDQIDLNGELVPDSQAWLVRQIFNWIGNEGRTLFWVARELNRLGYKAPAGGSWRSNRVCKVVRRRCYTGKNVYNSICMVPNPNKPLGDITAQIKRTISRPKPEDEWVYFNVSTLVEEELWKRANESLTKRGRGRGKEGKKILALLRNRIYCPRCGLPLVVRRDGKHQSVFYHCKKCYQFWEGKGCGFKRFIPAVWDECIWDCVYALLNDESWIEQQLLVKPENQETTSKMIAAEERKISQLQAKITRVQAGYEDSIYSAEEAKTRIQSCRKAIDQAEQEKTRLEQQMRTSGISPSGIDSLKRELEVLRRINLESASFEDKLKIFGLLDIKVYPSEDLKTVRIGSKLGITSSNISSPDNEQNYCGKVLFAPPEGLISRTKYSLCCQVAGTGSL